MLKSQKPVGIISQLWNSSNRPFTISGYFVISELSSTILEFSFSHLLRQCVSALLGGLSLRAMFWKLGTASSLGTSSTHSHSLAKTGKAHSPNSSGKPPWILSSGGKQCCASEPLGHVLNKATPSRLGETVDLPNTETNIIKQNKETKGYVPNEGIR